MKRVKYKYPYKARARKSPITKELKAKHKEGITLAPLDIALRKNIITSEMYQAANYFIYLYSLKFGSSHLKRKISPVYNFDEFYAPSPNESWLEKHNSIFNDIIVMLTQLDCYKLVLNICVYEQFPIFLKKIQQTVASYTLYNKFYLALEELIRFLKNKATFKCCS
jgi:hypothetical protein